MCRAFAEHIIAEERKLGHEVKEIRIDADPKPSLPKLREHFEQKGVTIQRRPEDSTKGCS